MVFGIEKLSETDFLELVFSLVYFSSDWTRYVQRPAIVFVPKATACVVFVVRKKWTWYCRACMLTVQAASQNGENCFWHGIHPSICLCVCLSLCLSVYLFVSLSAYLSLCLISSTAYFVSACLSLLVLLSVYFSPSVEVSGGLISPSKAKMSHLITFRANHGAVSVV